MSYAESVTDKAGSKKHEFVTDRTCFARYKFEAFANIGIHEMHQKEAKASKVAAEELTEYEVCPVCGEHQASPAHV